MDIEDLIQSSGCPYIRKDPQGVERLEPPENVREVTILNLIKYERMDLGALHLFVGVETLKLVNCKLKQMPMCSGHAELNKLEPERQQDYSAAATNDSPPANPNFELE